MSLGFRCLPIDCSAITLLSPGIKPVQVVACTDYQVVCNSGSAVNFGRLKAQRLRVFGQKVARRKQDNYDYDNQTVEDAPLNVYSSSLSKSEFLDQQKRLDAVRCRCLSKESRLPETKSTRQNVRTRGDMDHSEIAVKTGIKHPSKSQHSSTKFKEHDRHDVSVPRVPVTSLRGWGNGGFTPNVQFKPTDNAKQWWKSPSESAFFSRKSFRELGCNDTMIDSLGDQHILRPSCIQALAFAPVIGGKCCIIADQSGSGKTLAYLLPVIQRLRQEELQGLGKSLPQNPRVVILVPTAELACQVLRNCRSISRSGVPFRSMVATGGFRQRTQLESLQQDLDVLIATPGRFLYLIREGLLQLTNLRCAVLDEVDILLNNEEYEPALQSLINSSPVTTQYLFVTATLPMDIYNKLVEVFPDCEVIMGPGMHRTSRELEEILVDCSGDGASEKTPDTAFSNKKSALLQLIEETSVTKTIIFCNKIETCRKIENVLIRLDRKGIHKRVLPFHAALAQESRLANMEEFCSSQSKDKSLFFVCTDRASRGIDFMGVDHVVLFDFPRDPSEYVRRVGRTARGAGGKGKAFIFVVGKQVSLARRIIERNRKGHPLHDVPAGI
ncbi:DEAD-box ATP-dependent RNA helicase [Actinidia chinensis var. chinensis]|uniref:DEAD-box ATP-dependent RNA helicase n=1 Tax=Actinidia chinensis var. chinensis TaxID=1590841 RepID=A0A2R6R238_ACTCC|nr:DEAD-box ATP-dependent RNA helicase [Actinidia chinensis var. chinensis]